MNAEQKVGINNKRVSTNYSETTTTFNEESSIRRTTVDGQFISIESSHLTMRTLNSWDDGSKPLALNDFNYLSEQNREESFKLFQKIEEMMQQYPLLFRFSAKTIDCFTLLEWFLTLPDNVENMRVDQRQLCAISSGEVVDEVINDNPNFLLTHFIAFKNQKRIDIYNKYKLSEDLI